MANKYDLKTAVMSVASDANVLTAIGSKISSGIISSGKTRFLTYIRITRSAVASGCTAITGHIGSVANGAVFNMTSMGGIASFAAGSAATAVSEAVLPIGLQYVNISDVSGTAVYAADGALVQSIPDRPDINHPILAITGTGSNFLGIYVPSGPGCRIFAQYYDE